MNFNVTSLYLFLLIPLAIISIIFKPREKWWLIRAFIYIMVFLILLKPYAVIDKESYKLPKVGIFVDASLSMSVENRVNKITGIIKKIKTGIGKHSDIKLFEFGKIIKKVNNDDYSKIKAVYGSTDISRIIKESGLDSKIIISDGRYNNGADPLAMNALSLVPVFTIGVGSKKIVPDIGINDLKTPGIGFRNQKVIVKFKLTNNACSSGKIMVYLKEKDNLISRKEIELGSEKEIPVSLEFIPVKSGLKNYTIITEKISGEINISNNRRNFQLQVNREKIRVLYVSGQPSWEYSFFRRLVKSDPQIELVSFLILRNPANVTIVPEYELSLIHFPAREMFTKEIYEFDLLIYDNFSYSRFFPRSYLTHIKKFVLKGGGFIMLGGEDSFKRGKYADTPIAEILPVYMNNEHSNWTVKKFKAIPSKSMSHPILNLAEDEKISDEVWNDMPELEGYDPALEAKPDATVLVSNEEGIPILTVTNAGKGRAMAFNTNTAWRWCMGLSSMGKTPYYYNRFWYKVIRYMIQSGDQKNVQIFPGKDRANVGDKINVNIKVLDQFWQPVNTARVKVHLKTPSGKRVPAGWIYHSGDEGWYNTVIPVTEEGLYRITARAYEGDKLLDEGVEEFAGMKINRELLNTSLNKELLEKIAELSGGQYFSHNRINIKGINSAVKKAFKDKKITKKINWYWWPCYIFLAVILLLEWYFRRRRGLP